jgi:Uncharacterized conserved protein
MKGVAYVIVKHTTCAITINEAERGLMSDYIEWAKKLVPPEGEFRHNIIDNNGHAHVVSSIIGNQSSTNYWRNVGSRNLAKDNLIRV